MRPSPGLALRRGLQRFEEQVQGLHLGVRRPRVLKRVHVRLCCEHLGSSRVALSLQK